jgi:hypothetical protein
MKKRTECLHRAAARKAQDANQQADFIDFADWRKERMLQLPQVTGHMGNALELGSESEMSSQSSDNSERDGERPAKRQRTAENQVRYDVECLRV